MIRQLRRKFKKLRRLKKLSRRVSFKAFKRMRRQYFRKLIQTKKSRLFKKISKRDRRKNKFSRNKFKFSRNKFSRRKFLIRFNKRILGRKIARLKRFNNKLRKNSTVLYKKTKLKGILRKISPRGRYIINIGAKARRRKPKKTRKKWLKRLSSKVRLNLFKISYQNLLNYHSPLGKRTHEWKQGVMMTNILLIRNAISILDLTSIFFTLRKMVNRIFKALKYRKGIALLNGRDYNWTKVFTFVFSKWLPGFFTNFALNARDLFGYFLAVGLLTRRQKTRLYQLKWWSLDRHYFKRIKVQKSFTYIKKTHDYTSGKREPEIRVSKKKIVKNLIDFLHLPSVSVSLIDDMFWLRECQKEGISAVQIADASSKIENVDYPVVSNQQSIAFLSFLSLLVKEICYQGRFWEINRFKKKTNYYRLHHWDASNNLADMAVWKKHKWDRKLNKFLAWENRGYLLPFNKHDYLESKVIVNEDLIRWCKNKRVIASKLDNYLNTDLVHKKNRKSSFRFFIQSRLGKQFLLKNHLYDYKLGALKRKNRDLRGLFAHYYYRSLKLLPRRRKKIYGPKPFSVKNFYFYGRLLLRSNKYLGKRIVKRKSSKINLKINKKYENK